MDSRAKSVSAQKRLIKTANTVLKPHNSFTQHLHIWNQGRRARLGPTDARLSAGGGPTAGGEPVETVKSRRFRCKKLLFAQHSQNAALFCVVFFVFLKKKRIKNEALLLYKYKYILYRRL